MTFTQKDFNEDSEFLIYAIKKFSGIDLKKNFSRKRKPVEAKMVYIKKMREYGYTCELIAKELKLNHTAVSYHSKNFEGIKRHSQFIRDLEESLECLTVEDRNDKIKYKIRMLERKIKELKKILEENNN